MRVIDINLINVLIIVLTVWLAKAVMTIAAARWPNKLTVSLAAI